MIMDYINIILKTLTNFEKELLSRIPFILEFSHFSLIRSP